MALATAKALDERHWGQEALKETQDLEAGEQEMCIDLASPGPRRAPEDRRTNAAHVREVAAGGAAIWAGEAAVAKTARAGTTNKETVVQEDGHPDGAHGLGRHADPLSRRDGKAARAANERAGEAEQDVETAEEAVPVVPAEDDRFRIALDSYQEVCCTAGADYNPGARRPRRIATAAGGTQRQGPEEGCVASAGQESPRHQGQEAGAQLATPGGPEGLAAGRAAL
jgi:hypothetical protein